MMCDKPKQRRIIAQMFKETYDGSKRYKNIKCRLILKPLVTDPLYKKFYENVYYEIYDTHCLDNWPKEPLFDVKPGQTVEVVFNESCEPSSRCQTGRRRQVKVCMFAGEIISVHSVPDGLSPQK